MKSIFLNFDRFKTLALGCALTLVLYTPAKAQSVCFSLEMPVVSGNTGDIVSLPFMVVKGYANVMTMGMEFGWPAGALQFHSLQFGSNPLGLSNANFNPNVPGNIKFTWFDANAIGVTLPDSAILFTLNLRVLNTTAGFYPISMVDNSGGYNEIISDFIGLLPIAYEAGGVYVNTPLQPRLQTNNFCMINASNCITSAGFINFSASGGTMPYTFLWSSPNGYTATTQNISGLAGGYYHLTVTDQNGWSAQATVKLFGGAPVTFSGQITDESCSTNDGCINLAMHSGQPPFSFTWSAGDTTQNICDLSPGTYTVTVNAADGCSKTDSFTVSASSSLTVGTVASNANCVSNQFGTAAALPQNGVPPFQYVWTTGDTSPVIVGLFAGAYTVTVTDADGCTGIGQASIGDVTVSAWGLELIPECPIPNHPRGNLLLSAADTTNIHFPVTLQWSSGTVSIVKASLGNTLENLTSIPSGLYGVTVTDSIGCAIKIETVLNCLLNALADSAIFMWPGDADQNRTVNHHDLLYIGLGFGAVGPVRPDATEDWIGQPAPDWQQSIPHRVINFRHLDANGDGIINSADTMAIWSNWGQVVNPLTDNPFAVPQSVPGMATTPAPALSFSADTLLVGQTAPVPLILGSGAAPVQNLHGLSFSISYDPKILHPLYFEPLPSWFGDPADGLLCVQRHFPGQHRLDVALTRTDGVPADGFGIIGRTFIVIEDDIFLRKQIDLPDGLLGDDATLVSKLFLRGVQALTPDNVQPEIAPIVSNIVIRQTVHANEPVLPRDKVFVWPNPVSDVLHVASPDAPLVAVQIWDTMGRRVVEVSGESASEIDIHVNRFTPGLYSVRVETAHGYFHKTIICH